MKNYLNHRKENNIESLEGAYRLFNSYQKILKQFLKVDIQGKILDVGSGAGSFLKALADQGFDARGIDIDKIDFEKDKFPFESGEFDFVFANAVIEHIFNPDIFLSEIKRVLKKSGYFVMNTPNWRLSYKIFYRDPTHKKPYDPESLKHALNLYGFKVVFLNPNFINRPLWYFKLPFRWKMSFVTKSMIAVGKNEKSNNSTG